MAEENLNNVTIKARKSQKTSPIATANDKTDEEFIRDYLKPRYIEPMPNEVHASIPYTPLPFSGMFLIR